MQYEDQIVHVPVQKHVGPSAGMWRALWMATAMVIISGWLEEPKGQSGRVMFEVLRGLGNFPPAHLGV